MSEHGAVTAEPGVQSGSGGTGVLVVWGYVRPTRPMEHRFGRCAAPIS